MYLNYLCQCVGRCSLYLLASLDPSLAALRCISPKGPLTWQAAYCQRGGGVDVCDGV